VATIQAAHAFLVSGDVSFVAERQVRAAVAVARASGYSLVHHRGLVILARLHMLQGRLREAVAAYDEAGGAAPVEKVLQVLDSSVPYSFGLGDLLREWNRLDEAKRAVLQGMEQMRGARSIFADDVLQGHVALARLYQASGDYAEAIATMETFAQLAEVRHYDVAVRAQAAAVRAQLELMQGSLAEAVRWAEQSGLSMDASGCAYPRERELLTLARVRIAQGQADAKGPLLRNVLRLLDRLLKDAESQARLESVVEILILQALTLAAQGDRKQSIKTLGRTLTQAAPEGYIRLFIDEGAPMLVLLRQAREYGIAPDYVETLLAAFGEPVTAPRQRAPSPEAGIEPLTEREHEVLRLLATGASNGEIARRLVVSVGTVKRHVSNLCGKLGAQSRTHAVVRARALNLL
jgi:LuxR family maltose regulon positive regulatory protein